ncbi:MAG: 16S rRNA (guanine(527)-N(7))-methyltransferase RsmG [Pseudomonadota bacterium]|nr:16S rRNA (guanine(527)-N(7))-methyltransferase RsmG [Pseudomonadota bacterium]
MSLRRGCARLGLSPSDRQVETMIRFVDELARWNAAYNLTAIRQPAQMVTHHLLDSLAVLPYLSGARILDLGTGAGLPGIPFAIMAPERQFVLLDANGKKIRFVRHAIMTLGLGNVQAVQGRAESHKSQVRYDTVVARAVGASGKLAALAKPHCALGGRLLLMKGAEPGEQLSLNLCGYRQGVIRRLDVPHLEAERHVVEWIRVDDSESLRDGGVDG